MSRLGSLIRPSKQFVSLLKDACSAQKKPLLGGTPQTWRQSIMLETVRAATHPSTLIKLEHNAKINLEKWAENSQPAPKRVQVLGEDWGEATFRATKTYGTPYAVLNMANATYPGGAFLEGGSAQEENMFHRTTCVNSLESDIIKYDKTTNSFCYTEYGERLLEAKVEVSETELQALQKARGEENLTAHKAFFDRSPRVCFRGPEILVYYTGFFGDEVGRTVFTDRKQSYTFLPTEKVFPFHELRSAAPQQVHTKVNLQNDTELNEYKAELRRRIASQLDTLILEKQPNVILSAWGCGAFQNVPDIVADIYAEEIEKRKDCFEHIVFAIDNSSPVNYKIFASKLEEIDLGPAPSPSVSNTRR